MDTERNRDPGILISSVIDCVSDLVIQMCEDLAEKANDFAEKGKFFFLKIITTFDFPHFKLFQELESWISWMLLTPSWVNLM